MNCIEFIVQSQLDFIRVFGAKEQDSIISIQHTIAFLNIIKIEIIKRCVNVNNRRHLGGKKGSRLKGLGTSRAVKKY